jgi:3-oxoacyl-[acyl-carrier-protein] synthase II
MAQSRDKHGRPIVAVTGMGIVTSLGAGKTDNWASLIAGKSGIRAITRFPTDGLKTRVAGTVDFVPIEPLTAPALAERLAEIAI